MSEYYLDRQGRVLEILSIDNKDDVLQVRAVDGSFEGAVRYDRLADYTVCLAGNNGWLPELRDWSKRNGVESVVGYVDRGIINIELPEPLYDRNCLAYYYRLVAAMLDKGLI